MLPPADPVRLVLPSPSPPPQPSGIPIAAAIAPVVMSVAIWAFTQSLLSLVFAGLGPVVAAAGLVDARIRRRRLRRAEGDRVDAAIARLRERVAAVHEQERARRAALCAPEDDSLPLWAASRWVRPAEAGAPVPVRVGRGTVTSPVRLEGDDPDIPIPGAEAVWSALRIEAAGVPDAPLLVDAADGVGLVGPLPLAAAAARAVTLQVAALVAPEARITAPEAESWVADLPHAVELVPTDGTAGVIVVEDGDRTLRIAWARDEAALTPGCGTVLRPGEAGRVPALDRVEARERASALAAAAVRHGLGAAATAPPDRVELAALLGAQELGASADSAWRDGSPVDARPAASLAAPIGRDARGPVVVDLVADGPHALVGGTTGSGKSELLVGWVLAMAHGRTPDDVTFLLIDFKGGAAFAPLAGLPHVVGILSDLDTRLTRRAIESLRAELLRRERLLAEAGARSIAELPRGALARLVVVVDEFAAVVAGQPELHEVFGDLAARGRSLGLHLVLCTQRPAGVVRDGVLANVTLRIGLRMTDRGDSIALLGDDGAARLPTEPRGRAVLAGEDGTRRFQVAIAGAADLERARGVASSRAARPWLDPLPALLPGSAIGAASAEAIPFGLEDLPAEQRQPVAVHRPGEHGHLLVTGATGSGRTTALGVLSAAPGSVVLPSEPADAWQVLDELRSAAPAPERRLLLIDDLDLLLGRVDPETRHDLAELLARVLREGPAHRLGVAASVQRVGGALQPLAGLFGSRLMLRMASRDEHVLAGGAGAEFDPGLPPGGGRWRGAVVQVAWPGDAALPAAPAPELPVVVPAAGGELAIVAGRPGELLAPLRAAGVRVTLLDPADASVAGTRDRPGEVLLGDPDTWLADWALLTRARRELRIAVTGCSAAELRAVARPRDAPPLLGARDGECWLVEGGAVRRAVLAVGA